MGRAIHRNEVGMVDIVRLGVIRPVLTDQHVTLATPDLDNPSCPKPRLGTGMVFAYTLASAGTHRDGSRQ